MPDGNTYDNPQNDADKRLLIARFIEAEAESVLIPAFRVYIRNAHYLDVLAIPNAAYEVLGEVWEIASAKAAEYDSARPLAAWLKRIGLNIIKQHRDAIIKSVQRQSPVEAADDAAIFERVVSFEDILDANAVAEAILAQVSPEDQRILRAVILHHLDYTTLSASLGKSEAAVRQKFHRALERLRDAYARNKRKIYG